MAGSQQITASGSPQVLAAVPGSGVPGAVLPGPVAWFYVANTDATNAVYLGGVNVSSSNGAKVAAGGTFTGYLFSGDTVYVIAAAGSPVVAVLQTGA